MRKTKIVCTIGPACSDEKTLEEMCLAGMNVARLNFSHGTHEQHLEVIRRIKKVREKLNLPIAILLDTKGPEYRIGKFRDGKILLNDGDSFTLTVRDVVGNNEIVSVSYRGMIRDLEPGDRILINNGLVELKVVSLTETDAICSVTAGGVLSDRKSMSFPGKLLRQKYLSEQDKQDLKFGIENGVDFIACSFVSRRQDLTDVRQFLAENGMTSPALIAKIENRSGVENIEEICEECDGIMIGRGDMGVEIPFEELPAIQKQLITKCSLLGKRVITATEMLESMIHNIRPTRAEITDVANAVYDGTSAIMLSGETAAGEHPVLAVRTMSRIAEYTEKNIHYEKRFRSSEFRIRNITDAISHATCGVAMDIGAKAITVCTLSGMTARMVSRFRPPMDIVGMTTNEQTWRQLALSWGVVPVLCEEYNATEVMFYMAKDRTRRCLSLDAGERIVITGGQPGRSGNTDLIKVESV